VGQYKVSRKDEKEMKKILSDLEAADRAAVGIWKMFSKGPEYLELLIKDRDKK